MALSDGLPDERANLISAAYAAASWARARRSTWTDAPLAVPATALEGRASPAEIAPPPLSPPPVVSRGIGPSVAARTGKWLRALRASVTGRLPRVATAAALVAFGVVAGGLYLWNSWSAAPQPTPRNTVLLQPVLVRPQVPTRKATGGLQVKSTPVGAQVMIDGQARGVTPLTLTDLIPGRHTIELTSDAGTVQRTVNIAANKTAVIDESIFSGWLTVYSPFDLVITEGGRALRLDDRNQIMLGPGAHELRLANRSLGYDAVRRVELKPGEMTTLSVTPPPSTMTVTATEAAEVWLDGARVGQTPLNALPVELGTHVIVMKRATGGERRFTVTVTVSPLKLNVDFSRPAA